MRVFWTCSHFPFLLSGKITKVNKNGRCQTEEFGPGRSFKPYLIMSDKKGLKLKKELDKLLKQRIDIFKKLVEDYQNKLHILLKDYKNAKI